MVQEDFPKKGRRKKEKANTCWANKKPQMCSKKIPRRKTGQTEEEHMFVGVFFCRNCVCLFLRRRRRLRACALCFPCAGVWLSLILRGRGRWLWAVSTLLSVRKCPPPSLCCLSIKGLLNCSRSLLIRSEVARNRCVGCNPWIPKALCCIHET